MRKMAGTFSVTIKRSTTPAQIKVPVFKGIFNPALSATHPQELSPIAMPTIATENIKPKISGGTPIEYSAAVDVITLGSVSPPKLRE